MDSAAASRNGLNLSQVIKGMAIPAFVIDKGHIVTHWNRACEKMTGISSDNVIGTRDAWKAFYPSRRPVMADLIVDQAPEETVAEFYQGKYTPSNLVEGAYEAQDLFPHLGDGGKWLYFTATPLRDAHGSVTGAIETFQDITKRRRAEKHLKDPGRRPR